MESIGLSAEGLSAYAQMVQVENTGDTSIQFKVARVRSGELA